MIILPQDDHLLTAAEAAEWDRKMAVDDAYRRGAEAMKAAAANIAEAIDSGRGNEIEIARAIRAIRTDETA